ncbi:hypothetical protein PM082_022742 [Marasmius tenuissimus]|nr:hypothetical protein PM082_022742 [Marasmius tenuissimus]
MSITDCSIAKLRQYFEYLESVGVVLPELIKALILIQAIPKNWEAPASKCLRNYGHEDCSNDSDDEEIKLEPTKEPLTLNRVQDTILVEYEHLNPQFAGRLTAVKHGDTNSPSFHQQQCPKQQQQRQQQQRGQQQQQNQSQQQNSSLNCNDSKKKKQLHGT